MSMQGLGFTNARRWASPSASTGRMLRDQGSNIIGFRLPVDDELSFADELCPLVIPPPMDADQLDVAESQPSLTKPLVAEGSDFCCRFPGCTHS